MIRHLFKLIWNRRKRNFLIMSEIFISFIVLFAVGGMIFHGLNNTAKPLGFEYKNVWVLSMNWKGSGMEKSGESEENAGVRQVLQEMQAFREIRNLTWASSNIPYSGNTWSSSLEYNNRQHRFHIFYADDDFASVMGIPLIEGRWFNKEEDVLKSTPLVINRQLREAFFGSGPAIGQTIVGEEKEYTIIGVIDQYRYKGEFEKPYNVAFRRNVVYDTASTMVTKIMFAVREGLGVEFEERLMKRLASVVRDWTLNIERLEDKRASYFQGKIVPIAVIGIIAGFLVFNVALGLFGVLWYSISRRRDEIGVRRAMGASSLDISKLILGETVVIAAFGIAAGVFVAIQVPIIGVFGAVAEGVYGLAALCSAILILVIVSTCAVYPGWLAARIQPAMALHSE
ncbi:MAG: ABC transporter permease [Candidatus Zixiibacteriota bacterium]|nr:MAG: ABC transporter permease [candidate division Zixibacteria bacterium]